MTWIKWLFSLAIKLYPRQFRARFAEEMEEVFLSGLLDAKKNRRLAGYLASEFMQLPVNLIGVYIWSMQKGEGQQIAVSSMGSGGSGEISLPGEGWGSSIMAGLPHLLIAVMIVGSEIMYSFLGGNQQVPGYIFTIGFAILAVSLVIYNRLRGWKIWSASWLVYIFGIGITLLSLVVNAIPQTIIKNSNFVYEAQTLLIPPLLAYLLYKITCKDRKWGLLAAIPPAIIIWTLFLEFVPTMQKTLAWGWIFLLAFTGSVLIVHTKSFTTALILAMAVSVFGGFPFVYFGVYSGGALPFSKPGPSVVEVLRQYLPFLVVALAIILGPQLAVKLRHTGNQYAKEGGKIFYRLALGGLLFGFIFSLIQWATSSSGFSVKSSTSNIFLVLYLLLFLVGYGLLLWIVHHNQPQYGDNSDTVELIALFFPLFFIPFIIFMVSPILMGNYSDSWWLPVGEIGWVVASTLIVRN
jgi:uncharacterized membrane protein YedE/YeeE